MNINKKAPMLIGTILFLIFIVGSATYAYFSNSIKITSNIGFNTVFASTKPIFTSLVEKDLDLHVYRSDMLEGSSTSATSDNGIIKVNLLSSKDDMRAVCTYDIVLVWEAEDYVPSTTLPAHDADNNEFPYELSLKASRTTTGDDGYSYLDKNLAEINLDKIGFMTVGEEKRATIISGAEIHNQSSSNSTTTTWNLTLSFYSLPVVQDALLGKTYSGRLVVTNVKC